MSQLESSSKLRSNAPLPATDGWKRVTVHAPPMAISLRLPPNASAPEELARADSARTSVTVLFASGARITFQTPHFPGETDPLDAGASHELIYADAHSIVYREKRGDPCSVRTNARWIGRAYPNAVDGGVVAMTDAECLESIAINLTISSTIESSR